MAPALSPDKLRTEQASRAVNCKLGSGALKAWRALAPVDTLSKAGPIEAVYWYLWQHWFHWDQAVDVVAGVVAKDTTRRVYWSHPNGSGIPPRMTDASIATAGGDGKYPSNWYELGIPAPENGPTAQSNAGCELIDRRSTLYVYTYVSAWDEEGPPSPASGQVEVCDFELPLSGLVQGEKKFHLAGDQRGSLSVGVQFRLKGSTANDGTYTIAGLEYFPKVAEGEQSEGPEDMTVVTVAEVIPDETADGTMWPKPVVVGNLGGAPTGNHNVTRKRIYRRVDGAYLLVAEVDAAVEELEDEVLDSDLGSELPSLYWDPPPASMHSLERMANGICVGLTHYDVCVSEAYLPHAWPENYRHVAGDYPVGAAAFGNNAAILTKGYPEILTGVDPGSMTLTQLKVPQACVSKRSITTLGEAGVAYASPDGLVVISLSGVDLVTGGVVDRDTWQGLQPETMHCHAHDSRVFGFYDTGAEQAGFVLDPRDPESGLVWLDFHCTAGFADVGTDRLYLVQGQDVLGFDTGGTLLPYEWKSRPFRYPSRLNFPWARVVAESYTDVTLKIYAGGALRFTKAVADDAPFRLPAGFEAREWQVELSGTDTVRGVYLDYSPEQLG